MTECNSTDCNSIECSSYETHNILLNLGVLLSAPPLSDEQEFRLNKVNEIKDYFVAEIKKSELMSKRFSKYIAFFDYFDKSLIILSVTIGTIFIASFVTVIVAPVGMASASFSLAFSISTGIIKKLLKTTRNNNKKPNKVVMMAKSKLNSMKSKISEALIINDETSHGDFLTITNAKNISGIKRKHQMMNSQRNDVENINLIEEGKKIGINEVIKRNEIINNSLKL